MSATETAATTHGTVSWYNGTPAANVVMASMVRLEAARLSTQEQTVQDALSRAGISDVVITAAVVSAIAGTIGATAAVVGATAGITTAGVNVANLVNQANATGYDSLEIVIENRTATPIVLSSYSTSDSSSVSMPGPISPGGEDSATIVNSDGSFGKGEASVVLNFLVGGGVTEGGDLLQTIPVTCKLSYNGNGNWAPALSIDGSTTNGDTSYEDAFAATFISSSSLAADFTVVSQGLEKSTAEARFVFLPSSAPLNTT